MGFDRCILSCIHHYSITQDSFSTLKIPMFHLLNFLSPVPKSLEPLNFLLFLHPFLACLFQNVK